MDAKTRITNVVYQFCADAELADSAVVAAQAALDNAKQNALDARSAAKQISDALGVDLAVVVAAVAASAVT